MPIKKNMKPKVIQYGSQNNKKKITMINLSNKFL